MTISKHRLALAIGTVLAILTLLIVLAVSMMTASAPKPGHQLGHPQPGMFASVAWGVPGDFHIDMDVVCRTQPVLHCGPYRRINA